MGKGDEERFSKLFEDTSSFKFNLLRTEDNLLKWQLIKLNLQITLF